ncbi:MAG: hypothetical protein II890_06290 [Spirochaetia bacterium]|nr:hypothetical protein [Spirochaetia bacterium]MBQ3713542.1 hypothetical protein [Spirochaetia bacterium]
MTRKILLLFILLFSLLSVPAFATLQSVSDNTIMMYNLTVWGMNLGVGYKGFSLLEDRDTILWALLGGRGTKLSYFRDIDDDDLDVYIRDYDDISFWSAHLNWGLGFSQGLINDVRKSTDLLYFSIFYKGVREWYYEDHDDFFKGDRADREGLLQNSVVFELALDSVLTDRDSGMRRGFFTNATFEYAPNAFFNSYLGDADFRKYYAQFKFFIPIHDFEDKTRFACLYFGNSSMVDYVTGSEIPIYARHHIGSLSVYGGLGGLVRGYETYRFDSGLKLANRSEFRLLLKKIHFNSMFNGKAFLRCSTITFFDMGYYGFLDGSDGGFICSTGVGGLISFMDIISLSGYIAFPLTEERLDRNRVVPILGFSFKF